MPCPVDPRTHPPAVDVTICRDVVIGYTIDSIVDTVDYALGRPSSTSHIRRPEHAKFAQFVPSVLQRAQVTMPTLLVTLVYIQRAKHYIHIASEQWALERVFLGALIVASKYINDSAPKNVHWSICTGVFGKRDINRIEREFLDVLNYELYVNEDDIISLRQILTTAAHPSPSHRHSPCSVANLSRRSQQPTPVHTYIERYHSRRCYPPRDVPELQPTSPASSLSSNGSSVGPPTSGSVNGWGDARVRDNPNISGSRLRSPSFLKTTQAQFTHHDQPSINQPAADRIPEVLDKIKADTLCIACWEEPKNPAPNIGHLHDFSEILAVWKVLESLVQRPTELVSIWSLVEDYEKFIHELRLSISDGAHVMTEGMVNDFHQRLSDFVRDFKANANASDNSAPVPPHPLQVPSTNTSLAFFKGIGEVGISGGHFIMNVTQPIVPKSEPLSSSQFETYLKEIRNFTYFRTFIELAILF